MSKNIDQIFIANPITSNAGTDLMYFGQSPYGPGNDAAMLWSNFAAQFVATNVLTTKGDILTYSTQNARLAIGLVNGQVLQVNSAATTGNAWSTASYPVTTTINQILYSSAANTVTGLATANDGVLITSNTGVPSFLANSGTPGFVLTANTAAPPSWQAVSASGAITTINGDSGSATPTAGAVTISGGTTGLTTSGSGSTLSLTGVLKLINGGTNAALVASNGGIFYSTATAGAILSGTATANQALLSGASTAPAWSTATYPPTTTINQILYSSAANTITGLATANSAVLVTTSAGVPGYSGTMTNGQLIIGSTGATPTAATITAGTNISVTNGAGSITIATTGTASFAWNDVSGTSQSAAVNNGYIISNAAQTTVTLPATIPEGSVFAVQGKGAAGWILQANTGQTIHFGSSATSSAGSLTSTNQWDSVQIVCVTANTTLAVNSAVGNLTVA